MEVFAPTRKSEGPTAPGSREVASFCEQQALLELSRADVLRSSTMVLRRIAQLGEPVLRQRAREVPADRLGSEPIQTLIEDMIATMRDANGAGIAAPQVYEPSRVCVLELKDNPRYPNAPTIPLTVLINPIVQVVPLAEPIARDEDAIVMYEGCLSVSGLRGQVRRPRHVKVQALDRSGRPIEFECEGVTAAVVQHETDHLDGILFVDRADPKTLAFTREYERHIPASERILDGGQPPS